MRPRFFPNLILVAVLLAACAPVAATEAPPAETVAQPSATPVEEVVPTLASPATALPIATSRGPDLHATDPATVNLASGELHFVEFFRFT